MPNLTFLQEHDGFAAWGCNACSSFWALKSPMYDMNELQNIVDKHAILCKLDFLEDEIATSRNKKQLCPEHIRCYIACPLSIRPKK